MKRQMDGAEPNLKQFIRYCAIVLSRELALNELHLRSRGDD